MEIGIDSFAKKTQTNEGGTVQDDARAMSELIERIVHADKVFTLFGLTVWITNSYFYYSFSVAANPEILELLFLVLMSIKMTYKPSVR